MTDAERYNKELLGNKFHIPYFRSKTIYTFGEIYINNHIILITNSGHNIKSVTIRQALDSIDKGLWQFYITDLRKKKLIQILNK